jgi:uncharacterized protein (UPF0332 family)
LDNEVELIFKKSLYLLKVAEKNYTDKFYPNSINRSYYAVFHVAKALLIKKRIITKTHSGTIHKFGLEYVINGNFDKEIGKFFSKLEEDREKADYDYLHNITAYKAKTNLNNAKKFVEECEKFL